MTTFEEFYLITGIAAFLAFGTTLYMVDRPNRRWSSFVISSARPT